MQQILIIEDDHSLQRALRRTLERDGSRLSFADDAVSAIRQLDVADRMFGCFHYDHVLCDWDLGHGPNGGEVLAWIRARDEARTADDGGILKSPRQVYLERFTFLTGNVIAAGLHDRYVCKPCSPTMLRRVLATKGPICLTTLSGD